MESPKFIIAFGFPLLPGKGIQPLDGAGCVELLGKVQGAVKGFWAPDSYRTWGGCCGWVPQQAGGPGPPIFVDGVCSLQDLLLSSCLLCFEQQKAFQKLVLSF